MKETVLFISDKKYLNAEIRGGVQLCTREYVLYLAAAGYECRFFEISPHTDLFTRIKIRLGTDAYDRYPIKNFLQQICSIIHEQNIKLVLLNQVNIASWAIELRKHVKDDVKFIGLSHGNESADYVHEITKGGNTGKLQTYKLGKLIAHEARIFSETLDGVIVLSEQEKAIDQWLGASRILYLPRMLHPAYIDWQPESPNAGFAGTLDHLPNRLGIEMLADELVRLKFNYKLNIVGGPENVGMELQLKYNFINYKGPVSDESLLDEVSRWSLFINPVFWYARGSSTKLAQAINWGIPCITTPAGRRGYELINSEIVTADDSPAEFASTVLRALDNPDYLEKLYGASRQNAEEFDAHRFIATLDEFLKSFRKAI
ncbi:MAG TPA: glycosyltransferase [Mucilaginibacter sp.]|nr:glycosyltransferase [Mucilaginibacter sp.]